MNMLTRSVAYKPFQYPWAFEAFKIQNQLHWLPDEIPLADDVQDWNKKLTPAQRNLVTHIFRLFTQSDEEIGNAYIDQYMPRFKNNELRMMFLAFGNMEAIHMQSYSYLLDTIGMPETEYSAFLEYTEMRDKYELLQNYKMDTHHNTALSMAVFAAFTEGLQLFASFAMLMNFPRFNLMKNMGQIVTFSIRDETCMSDDTEVLTETGWKLFSDLDRTEKLAQFDGESNSVTFANPTHYTAHHYKGDMVRLYRDQGAFDILCTPDHDIVLRYINKEYKKDRIIKKKAEDVKKNLYYFLPTAGHAVQEGRGISLHERFLIALQADGSVQSGNRYSGEQCGCLPVTFFLKRERKQERLEKLLADLGYDYTKSPSKSKGGFVYRVKVPTEKLITKNFEDWNVNLSEKSEDWFSGFIAEVAEWDGHWIKDNDGNVTGRIHYSTVSKQNASFVQTVASLCGWRVKVKVTEDNRKETYRDVYRVMMTPNEEWTRLGYLKTERVLYDGMVYCATMPKGTLITRRNNAIGFVGNCHVQSIMKLFHEYVAQFSAEIDREELEKSIRDACRIVVDNEDRFIDLAFEMGPVEGLDAEKMKAYVRWIADMRLEGLGYAGMYHVSENPLPWLDDMLNAVEHTNFFENRATEYSRAATGGDWGDVF